MRPKVLQFGKTYQTKDGREARLICNNAIDPFGRTHIVLVHDGIVETPRRYTSDGRYYPNVASIFDINEVVNA